MLCVYKCLLNSNKSCCPMDLLHEAQAELHFTRSSGMCADCLIIKLNKSTLTSCRPPHIRDINCANARNPPFLASHRMSFVAGNLPPQRKQSARSHFMHGNLLNLSQHSAACFSIKYYGTWWSSGKVLETYSEGARFESRQGIVFHSLLQFVLSASVV
jgi:hypothetical protein